MKQYELSATYDSAKSFYGKAIVKEPNERTKVFFSYKTKVAEIKDGELVLHTEWKHSNTTIRHVREFMLQNGFPKLSKQEIERRFSK